MRQKMISAALTILVCAMLATAANGESRTRLLLEDVDPDQRLERFRSMPVIISDKQFRVALTPETIMPGSDTTLYFNLIVSNPTDSALAFSMDHLSAFSPKKALKVLGPEEVVEEQRRFFSREEYGISADEENILAPFVDQKMERLREKLMKNQSIAAHSRVAGMIAVHVPFGTDGFTIEVVTGNDTHHFKFNIGEF